MKIHIHVPFIVNAALEAGATPEVAAKLEAKLNSVNTVPSPLVDHEVTKALKIVSRMAGSVFEQPGEEPSSREATMRELEAATDLATRILLGQWRDVAQYIERTAVQGWGEVGSGRSTEELVAALTPEQQEANAERLELAAYLRNLSRHRDLPAPRKQEMWAPAYNAHRVACVMGCPFAGCAQNDCWETRRAFCGWDLEAEKRETEASVAKEHGE